MVGILTCRRDAGDISKLDGWHVLDAGIVGELISGA